VVQYIGTLDRPSRIGMVEDGMKWTVLDTSERTVSFSDLGKSRRYEALPASLKSRANRLVHAWETERWANRIAVQDN
jgi:hypothetical protein